MLSREQERLVTENMSYAKSIGRKVARKLPKNTVIDNDDVEQLSYAGLIHAATKFDPVRFNGQGNINDYFKVYAYRRIRGAIIDEARSQTFVRRRGIEKGLNYMMVSMDSDGNYQDISVEQGMEWASNMDLHDALDALSEREQTVIYGLLVGCSGREIAEDLGVTESRVSQIATAARDKMKEVLR